jgi:penicillin-binding protein 1C
LEFPLSPLILTLRHKFSIAFLVIIVIFTGIISCLFWDLPSLNNLPQNLALPSFRITDRHGAILYEIIDETGGRHSPIQLYDIPQHLINATIATEDQNFYSNSGIDFPGILRAFWINLQGGETLVGGSTITQQVIRNLVLTESEQFERTIRRKLRETWLSWRLTSTYSKEEILSLYLNQMYYGGLAYGVEAAAQTYFGKPASELDLAESALIAGLTQSPALYNPLVNPSAAKNRQKTVLNLMLNQGAINLEQYNTALREPIVFTSSPYPIEAPHFVMIVIAEFDQILTEIHSKKNQSLIIKTTLDLSWQNLAERAVERHLQSLHNTQSKLSTETAQSHNIPGGHNVNNAALVSVDPKTGEIYAMVGSPDYFDKDHAGAINMAISPRQPGSALKPFIYASAFDPLREHPMTPATMILDVATTFMTHEGKPYTPANYDNLEHGPVSARQALASSLNIPAVKVLDQIGLRGLKEITSKSGITTLSDVENYDLSLALGGGEVTLLELTSAYGIFANQGLWFPPISILEISTPQGHVIYRKTDTPPFRVIDERVAWLISDILKDNDARSIGFGINTALNIGRPAAVKTGTTTNFHDNWTIGYTPEVVVGVWVGNANHEPMRGVTGLSGAGPIWHQFIREILTGTANSWFEKPDGMTHVEICSLSGLLPSISCPYSRFEWFINGTEPDQVDNIYQQVWINSATGNIADENTPLRYRRQIAVLNLPPEAHSWARNQGLPLFEDFTASKNGFQIDQEQFPLKILKPSKNAVFQINPQIDRDSQRLKIEVSNNIEFTYVDVFVDGILLTTFHDYPYELWWSLESGKHTMWAQGLTAEGESFQSPKITITVEAGDQP